MNIFNAEKEHMDKIYELIQELENKEINKNAFFDVYNSNISNPNVFYLLAEENNEIIGFAGLHIQLLLHHTGRVGELQEIVIKEKMRGKGIGESLFKDIKRIAKESGCLQLEVCCNLKREKSLLFYKNQGLELSHNKLTMLL